jgi:hypothetical protein
MTKPFDEQPGADAASQAASDPATSLLARLRALPAPKLEPVVADRTRLRARSVFVRFGRSPRSPWQAAVGRAYGRAEPALAATLVLVYLTWALQTAAALVR